MSESSYNRNCNPDQKAGYMSCGDCPDHCECAPAAGHPGSIGASGGLPEE